MQAKITPGTVPHEGEEKRWWEDDVEEHQYTVILKREEDGGYYVFCPALRQCRARGDTLEDALINIAEAIEAHLEKLRKLGVAVPEGDVVIRPIEITL